MRPFEVLERVGTLAYKVLLPPSLSKIHNVFHVSTLRKYIYDPSHVLELEPIQIFEDLTYEDVTTRSQPCGYCPLWTQRDLKTFLLG